MRETIETRVLISFGINLFLSSISNKRQGRLF